MVSKSKGLATLTVSRAERLPTGSSSSTSTNPLCLPACPRPAIAHSDPPSQSQAGTQRQAWMDCMPCSQSAEQSASRPAPLRRRPQIRSACMPTPSKADKASPAGKKPSVVAPTSEHDTPINQCVPRALRPGARCPAGMDLLAIKTAPSMMWRTSAASCSMVSTRARFALLPTLLLRATQLQRWILTSAENQ